MEELYSLQALFCFLPMPAQSGQARIVGTVTDSSGAVLPKASVTVTDQKTGAKREASPDDKGFYAITNLTPSTYTVTATAANFANAEVRDYTLSAGQERNLNLSLQPGSVTTEVSVVSGALSEVETSSAAIGANVNSREVGTLAAQWPPTLATYILLTPGAQTAGGGSFDNIRFSGRANQQNAVRFDGIEGSSIVDASPGNLNGEISTGFRLQSSLETVAEFRVDSSNYPAEFGTGTGGQISVVTKSGGNAFHGGLFEYIRNNALDARNFFDGATKSPLRLNQFGGSIGGPIMKDKLFFFAAIESLRQRAGVNLVGTVPSAAARSRAVRKHQAAAGRLSDRHTDRATADLDLARLSTSVAQDEYFGSMRFDYHINDRLQRLFALQPRPRISASAAGCERQLLVGDGRSAEHRVGRSADSVSPQSSTRRRSASMAPRRALPVMLPPIPGVDTSAFAVSFTGTVAIPGVGGQGASAGASSLGNLIRSNSTQNGRGHSRTPTYTLSYIDSLSVIASEPLAEVRLRVAADTNLYRPVGRNHLHVLELSWSAGQHSHWNSGSRRHQRTRPV